MQALLDYASYMPHGYCLYWQPWLVILYAGSDLLIFLAYSAIPIALLMFLRRRPDLRYRKLVALFAAFIMLCGITHLISILTLWVPIYPLHGLVKLFTGVVSAITAVVLFSLIPRLVAIPSPSQLEEANAQLRAEVAAHERTLAQLQEAQRDLEAKVAERTAELTETNRRLTVVTREAVHRGRNLLTVVDSLARQTARSAPDLKAFVERFSGRIHALSNATAAVMDDPSSAHATLGSVVRRQLEPITETYGERVVIGGPEVEITNEAAQQLALATHELATNAVKYGALATLDGTLRLAWEITGDPAADATLRFVWQESDSSVRAAKEAPPSGGFGTTLLTRAVPAMLHGTAQRNHTAGGLSYELTVPLARIVAEIPSPKGKDRPGLDPADDIWENLSSPLAGPLPA
ncbi:sensor histidine kinase [Aurantimonas marianensis]|uniref:histidine kinase n=1 Tax=Aurantimonas marianensis TaxID=2920428 RepID=A0A9X2H5X8_9HYPH|nr:HWE histidine kinase domain-containing protein [Aurantimonas marianensis]MCP3054403.1 hypothetical protein [Aurantimonas marianensis]